MSKIPEQHAPIGLMIFNAAAVANPTYNLSVNGTAGKTGGKAWPNYSDGRLKENIGPLDGALEKITQLRGITYQWINPCRKELQSTSCPSLRYWQGRVLSKTSSLSSKNISTFIAGKRRMLIIHN
jgi:hypothetical protein